MPAHRPIGARADHPPDADAAAATAAGRIAVLTHAPSRARAALCYATAFSPCPCDRAPAAAILWLLITIFTWLNAYAHRKSRIKGCVAHPRTPCRAPGCSCLDSPLFRRPPPAAPLAKPGPCPPCNSHGAVCVGRVRRRNSAVLGVGPRWGCGAVEVTCGLRHRASPRLPPWRRPTLARRYLRFYRESQGLRRVPVYMTSLGASSSALRPTPTNPPAPASLSWPPGPLLLAAAACNCGAGRPLSRGCVTLLGAAARRCHRQRRAAGRHDGGAGRLAAHGVSDLVLDRGVCLFTGHVDIHA